jgi:hypothetical protein
MKKIIFATAMVLLMAVAFTSNAQKKPGEPKAKEQPLQQVTAFSGEVISWVNNDDYVYNGFCLQTSSTKFLVHFPAHMGRELTAAIKTGNTITVNGVENTTPSGEKEIKLVSVTANGTTINEKPPVKPTTPPAEEFINSSGKISELQKGKQGEVKGYILDNKTILRVSPNVAQQLKTLAIAGANISYSGEKQILHNGEVAMDSYTIIHCKTITINGKEYLTK